MELNKIASAIVNDILGGHLIPKSDASFLSIEQVEDECVAERESIIKQLWLANQLDTKDVAFAINCIPVDCEDQY